MGCWLLVYRFTRSSKVKKLPNCSHIKIWLQFAFPANFSVISRFFLTLHRQRLTSVAEWMRVCVIDFYAVSVVLISSFYILLQWCQGGLVGLSQKAIRSWQGPGKWSKRVWKDGIHLQASFLCNNYDSSKQGPVCFKNNRLVVGLHPFLLIQVAERLKFVGL